MDGRAVRRSRAATAAIAIALGLLASSVAPTARAGDLTRRERLFALTNVARAEHDRARVALVDRLSRYAKRHSRAMADSGYLFHSSTATLQRVLGPYRWSIGGENVGVGDAVASLQDAFMRSKPHRRNILRSAFDHTAIGIVRQDGKLWVTVIFYG